MIREYILSPNFFRYGEFWISDENIEVEISRWGSVSISFKETASGNSRREIKFSSPDTLREFISLLNAVNDQAKRLEQEYKEKCAESKEPSA